MNHEMTNEPPKKVVQNRAPQNRAVLVAAANVLFRRQFMLTGDESPSRAYAVNAVRQRGVGALAAVSRTHGGTGPMPIARGPLHTLTEAEPLATQAIEHRGFGTSKSRYGVPTPGPRGPLHTPTETEPVPTQITERRGFGKPKARDVVPTPTPDRGDDFHTRTGVVRDSVDTPKGPPPILKGTTFFGGAGMDGDYIQDMVKALEDAGLSNVREADRDKWSSGNMLIDAASVLTENSQDREDSDLSAMGSTGRQFNLIGYSYGGTQAAQAAIDYANQGGQVDHLVLIATPLEKKFLEKLQSHPNIKSVDIIDLPDQGDPVRAGMSDWDVVKATPEMAWQLVKPIAKAKLRGDDDLPSEGHFYYSDEGDEGKTRRRNLAKMLNELGLK